MTAKTELSAPKRRSRAEVQQFGGRVCEQRYAAEQVLPEPRFELQHSGSPSKEAAFEEKAKANLLGRSFGAGGVGGGEDRFKLFVPKRVAANLRPGQTESRARP